VGNPPIIALGTDNIAITPGCQASSEPRRQPDLGPLGVDRAGEGDVRHHGPDQEEEDGHSDGGFPEAVQAHLE